MHGLPCSSLGHCFGNPSDANTDPAPAQEPNNSRRSRNNNGLPAADPVLCQPEALPCSLQEQQHRQPHRTVSCISDHSSRTITVNGTNSNSISICHLQGADEELYFESPPACRSLSQSSEDDELEGEFSPELELKYPQIPRPSIIIRQAEESEFQETVSDRSDGRETEDGGLSARPLSTGYCGKQILAAPGGVGVVSHVVSANEG
ncbi:Cell division protein FtsZ [Dissostichus eleginoides]|uniref:Cell division protein FtsZ n=1 Tax=Dissostichus eleginoides TaxID=100907 RepID=A0AAD9F381_DISEL|nr:Cell division protein FtsZ [Dissostichus eleginoides]